MLDQTRREFLERICVGGLGLVVVCSTGDAHGTRQYRAVCVHGTRTDQIWRGPVRNSYAAADADRRNHVRNCRYNDSGVIQRGDLIW
jgi:hypothetical protein